MFQHLLVPLDGSSLAEAALPPAAYLARTLGASITLVHVIEHDPPAEVHSQRHLTQVQEAEAYLRETAERALPRGLRLATHVDTAGVTDVARSLVEHSEELRPDLIVMCTHGRTGARDLLFGSIAQQVIALGATPVLLIRPEAGKPPAEFTCPSLLVPLDGDPQHAKALPIAADLAQACSARLHLVTVVPTLETLAGPKAAASRLLPGATRALLDLEVSASEDSLRRHAAVLVERGLKATFEVSRGDIAPGIVAIAERIGAGMIVLATHGTVGSEAFWERSVPPKVSARTRIPVLFIPVREA